MSVRQACAVALVWTVFSGSLCVAADEPRQPTRPAPGNPAANEAKIRAALGDNTQLEFIETPLSDVVEYLSEYHGILVRADWRALEDAGIKSDHAITANLKGITLRSALRLTLGQYGLDYAIREEALIITTKEEAAKILVTRIYDVKDLVFVDGNTDPDFDGLIRAITSVVSPATWDTNGGAATIQSYKSQGLMTLVVQQTEQAHEQIVNFLASLRKLRDERPRTGWVQTGMPGK